MAEKKVMCSMIEIEREYYPKTFLERKNEIKRKATDKPEFSMAQVALKEIEDELESLSEVA
jgi:hypothetical protein